MLLLSQCLLFWLCCILPSVFQVKCSMLLWAIRWLLRRPVWSVRGGKLSWQPLASFMLPGDRVWTDVTMAGSLMVVHDIQFQYPESSVGEAWSVSGPCTATETRLASRNQLRSLELTVLKVNSLTSCCCQKIYSMSRKKKHHLPMAGHMVYMLIVWFRQWQTVIEGTEHSLSKPGLDCKELWSHLLVASAPPPFDFLPLCTTVSISTSEPDQHFNMFTTRLKLGSLFCSMYFLLCDCIVSVTTTTREKGWFLYERCVLCARLLIQMSVSSWPHCLTL